MLLLVSGEGPTDMGASVGNEVCNGGSFVPGPMAWLVDQLAEPSLYCSAVECEVMWFISERRVTELAKGLRPPTLPGGNRNQETAYFFRTARALAQLAAELSRQKSDAVVAVLFRDADGTRSAGRGHWHDKWASMLKGFEYEGFSSGVPMIPQPKSEAWLLCALGKDYRDCTPIEQASGNDAAPNSLKDQLSQALAEQPDAALLSQLVRDRRVDATRIDMPSLAAFRERLTSALGGAMVGARGDRP